MLDEILNGLMRRYKERVPDVNAITHAMIHEGIIKNANDIENDHIAFRTMGVAQLGIQSLEKIFLHYGYQKKGQFFFAAKKLNACWYAPPENRYPRVFISELRVNDLSDSTQKIIHSYTDEVKTDPVSQLNLDDAAAVDTYLHSGLWRTPTLENYDALLAESEYAAWVIFNHYYLNHYTISVHNLIDGYNTLEAFNAFLKRNGFKLNNAGGEIKISADGKLLQSSTVAEMIEAAFADGKKKMISGSYVEFADRRVLDQFAHLPKEQIRREHRRDGFEIGSADKIFESTYTSQTLKK
jgi:hypothetical protein